MTADQIPALIGIISTLLGIVTTAGAFVGVWLFNSVKELRSEVKTVQAENLKLVEQRGTDQAEIAGLKAQINAMEDARKERDRLRSQLRHRERVLDRFVPDWREEHVDDEEAITA